MKKTYMPRLKGTREHVEDISNEIENIRSDASLLPRMFMAEAGDRKRIFDEMNTAKK